MVLLKLAWRCVLRMAERQPEGGQTMSIGRVEYMILGLPDNEFMVQIAPESRKLVDFAFINIIDPLRSARLSRPL
jgi:hypothetical protein